MANRIAFSVVIVFLLLGTWDLIFPFDNMILSRSFGVARIGALIMMIANGTLSDRTYYYALIKLLIGLTLIGVLFKILHWTGADDLLFFCPTAIAVVYTIHFATKPNKGILGVLKLLTVITNAAITVLTFSHYVGIELTVTLAAEAILWVTFTLFIVDGLQKRNLFSDDKV